MTTDALAPPIQARGPSLRRRRGADALPRQSARERWSRRLPLLPALVFMIIVTQLPFVATLVISFMRWNALDPTNKGFVGIDNYKAVFASGPLRSSVLTTIYLTVSVVIISLIIGMAVALLLDRKFVGRGIVRTIMIAPFLVVPVAAALLFKHGIYNPTYGLINGVLNGLWQLVGLKGAPQPDLLSSHATIMVEVELIWQWTPFMMLILLAGLQSRDPEIIEAARVDGASSWQIFKSITFPHMRQYMELSSLLCGIFIVQNFDSVFTITSGGLGSANLPYTIYQTFYGAHDYGLASAQGVVVVIGSLIIATFALRVVSTLFREEGV